MFSFEMKAAPTATWQLLQQAGSGLGGSFFSGGLGGPTLIISAIFPLFLIFLVRHAGSTVPTTVNVPFSLSTAISSIPVQPQLHSGLQVTTCHCYYA